MFDASEFKDFFSKCSRAGNGDFKKALNTFLEGLGLEFLKTIQDEIIRLKVVDTRHLVGSFQKGNGIWELSDGGLTLVIGTNVEYARYVNDGHWTCKKGEAMRFVPGDVKLDSDGKIIEFKYNPSANTGMMLKQQWIEGRHFWESGLNIVEQIFPKLIEEKVIEWMENYFS